MWTGLKNVSYRSGATLYAASRIRKSYSRSIRMRKDVSTAAPPVAASWPSSGASCWRFVQGGYNKLFGGMAGTVATMTSHGIPFPNILVWGAVVVELGIGLCLIAGLLARAAALVLAAYTLVLGLIFYNHLSIIGGMLVVVAFGAGCWRHPGRDTPRSGASLIRNLS